MKTRNTTTRLIGMAIAVAILTGAAWLQSATAQIGAPSTGTILFAPIGFISGEKLSYNIANTDKTAAQPSDASVNL